MVKIMSVIVFSVFQLLWSTVGFFLSLVSDSVLLFSAVQIVPCLILFQLFKKNRVQIKSLVYAWLCSLGILALGILFLKCNVLAAVILLWMHFWGFTVVDFVTALAFKIKKRN